MKSLFSILLSLCFFLSFAQVDLTYQVPHENILKLADAPLPPSFRMNNDGSKAYMIFRKSFKTIAELSETELRLGGLRINPKTYIGSRTTYYYDMKIFDLQLKKEVPIDGLPKNARLANFSWSNDQNKVAFTNTVESGVELWIADLNTKSAKKITGANLNANMGRPMVWSKDDMSLIVKLRVKDEAQLIDNKSAVPTGPTISENAGKKAQNRTYQDLLKNKNDEHNFELLATSELWKVDLEGNKTKWMGADMYSSISPSPDGRFYMINTISKPFSYLVTYRRFPSSYNIHSADAKLIRTFLDLPLIEDLPKGRMSTRTGPRNIHWRADKGSTIVWAEAQDGGDPKNEVKFRDAVYQLEAPFTGEKRMLVQTINRFRYIDYGNNNLAIAHDYWWNNRNMKAYVFDPSAPNKEVKTIVDRNYQDRYGDPGDFVMERNKLGRNVLDIEGDVLYLIGDGYSDEGIRPFVDEYNYKTGATKRLYRADGKNNLEDILRAIDMKKGLVLSRIESKSEYPNYYFRNVKTGKSEAITTFDNPFKDIQNVHKELISYKREDGVDLSATLYLPVGYNKNSKEKLPMVMWAYPREYKDKSSAGQISSSPHEFTYPYYGSPVFWVTRGYAVLEDTAFPIIGEGEEEPNDSFREQLVSNAKAAIDAVDAMGYIDRNRIAVGGHSYGAFMTANLLAHCDLFAAGIARSGAYNRTLTPFGFQSEERSYWDAPEVYYSMSPFMHANKMNEPLLLIHGEADNNSGTYPMQSERYFNALKGLGATVRLVMFPKESHGYRARETILHLLWEQDQWLEKYVKNREVKVVRP